MSNFQKFLNGIYPSVCSMYWKDFIGQEFIFLKMCPILSGYSLNNHNSIFFCKLEMKLYIAVRRTKIIKRAIKNWAHFWKVFSK